MIHINIKFLYNKLSFLQQQAEGSASQGFVSSLGFDCSWLLGSGEGSFGERQTRDRKVSGSSPGRSDGRILFSRVSFLCWFLFRYPFHPGVTAVARKKSWSFCQKCRWQISAKHTCILRMWLRIKCHCNLVHGCMVYTELAPRRQRFHVAPAM